LVLLIGVGYVASDPANPNDQATYLTYHNNARIAVGEKNLTYNQDLALAANNYSRSCNFSHDPNLGALQQGENLYACSGSACLTPNAAMTSWLGEGQSYDCLSNTCAPGQSCDHYTQVVWSATTQFGCAYSRCKNPGPFDNSNWTLAVCRYQTPGNINGQRPFSANSCPEPPNLAISVNDYENNTAAQTAILNYHNTKRVIVNDSNVVWNNDLAEQASDWAQKCRIDNSNTTQGENIYSCKNTCTFNTAVSSWYAEISNFNCTAKRCIDTTKRCDQYLQMMFVSTTKIGCAVATCNNTNSLYSNTNWLSMVCRYSPKRLPGTRPFSVNYC